MTAERMFYENSNLESIDIPRRGAAGSARPTDHVLLSDLGAHVVSKCEAMRGDDELLAEFSWSTGALKGARVLDAATEKRFDEFVRGMSKAADKKIYFNREVRPVLYGLRPQSRKGDR